MELGAKTHHARPLKRQNAKLLFPLTRKASFVSRTTRIWRGGRWTPNKPNRQRPAVASIHLFDFMRIKQYRPAFFEGFENETVEFSTVEELQRIAFVKRHTDLPDHHRLSLTENNTLMAELDGGKKWFVVGFIKGGRPDLPQAIFESNA